MKRFKHILSTVFSPGVLIWLFPLFLTVPNVVLDITEPYMPLTKIANILLPLGVYMCIAGVSQNVGRTVVLCIPFIFFAAFQVVLLYLYGESIIAVDMYLNLVTTNVSEASELLGNLGLAIATVIVIYAVPLVWSVVLWRRGRKASVGSVRNVRHAGTWIICAAALSLAACYIYVPKFSILREIFPANVVNNMLLAIGRTDATNHYPDSSAGFDYHAVSTRPRGQKEIYVLVVGETSRADNWHLLGYGRSTNPRLECRDSIIVYSKAVSESNITHKSVPLALSCVTADNFGDSIYSTKSMVAAFRQAGYHTAWLSNQARNRSFIDFYAREAHASRYLGDDGARHHDHELLAPLRQFIMSSPADKNFIVLHTYGSHFNYSERYPTSGRVFTPDTHSQANPENRSQLINAYDNTIVYTDALLDSLIGMLDGLHCPSALLYFSDHGEDIFDDNRGRFLHASPVPTYHQLHVPVLLWLSQPLCREYPGMYEAAYSHHDMDISSSRSVFDTMLHLAGITTPYADTTKALTSADFAMVPRRYLNDYNECVPLDEAGIRDYDRNEFHKRDILYK